MNNTIVKIEMSGNRYNAWDSDGNRNMSEFKTMYGKDSQFVDVTSVTAVARTMNKKFLEKN